MKISICGDICDECPRYKATMTNDNARLEQLAELWFRLRFRDKILPPEELKCAGCHKDKNCSHQLTGCEHIKNINNCGECNYFPCEKIQQVFSKTKASDALCRQKCSPDEYNEMIKAFFIKEQLLTAIHESRTDKSVD